MDEFINLVDSGGQRTGAITKLVAHETGQLHEAFSVFIFNSNGELLLQKRASTKYHSGGLWTNTCCGHPREGEVLEPAAHRRMLEEMGLRGELQEVFSFLYRANLPNGLIEHEFDHVFIGVNDSEPHMNPEEADDYRWMNIPDLLQDIQNESENYTYWLKEIMKQSQFLLYLQDIQTKT